MSVRRPERSQGGVEERKESESKVRKTRTWGLVSKRVGDDIGVV